MKKILFLILSISVLSCNSQKKRALIGKTKYQQELNASYKDASKSPLKKKDLKKFKGLDFFPIDSSFIVSADLTYTPDALVFEMKTTTARRPLYKSYAIAKLKIDKKEFELTIFQSQNPYKEEKYKNYLFLPFTDLTSGEESYGGGRYMDVMLTDIEDNKITLNFNNTYNPYCAYNERYSCPITPRKNHLDIAIKAGVKKFKK